MAEPDVDEAKVAAKIAAFDQEQAEWIDDATKISTFYATLRANGVPKELAGVLTLNAQVNYYSDDCWADGGDE